MACDILAPTSTALDLAEAIKKADRERWNFAVPVRCITGLYNIGSGYQPKEYEALPNWSKVDMCGLGFYYGDLNSLYEWHEGEHGSDPDWNYVKDNNIALRIVKLPFLHIKEMPL